MQKITAERIWSLMAIAVLFFYAGGVIGKIAWDFYQPKAPKGVPVIGVASIPQPMPTQKGSEYDLIDLSHQPTDYYVCAIETPVKPAAGNQYPTMWMLNKGDNVQVEEWSKAGLWDDPGWAMIGRGIWVAGLDICQR